MKRKYIKPVLLLEDFVPQEYVATCYYMQCEADDYSDHYYYDGSKYIEKNGQGGRTHGWCMSHESIYNASEQKLDDITDGNRFITNVSVNLNGTKGDKSTYTPVTPTTIWQTIHDALNENKTLNAYWEEHDPDFDNGTYTEENPAIWYHYGSITKVGGPS